MASSETDLRAKNKSLISMLLQRQGTIHSLRKSEMIILRDMERLQESINGLKIGGRQKTDKTSQEGSSTSVNLNVNNSNAELLSSSPIRDQYSDIRPAGALSDPASPELKRRQLSTNDVTVIHDSPEEKRTVRRRLTEEITQHDVGAAEGEQEKPSVTCLNETPKRWTHSSKITPRKTPKSIATPKSILKHRRMIDSNIQVKSEFSHTPGWLDRAKRTVNIKSKQSLNKHRPTTRRLPPSAGKGNPLREVSFNTSHSEVAIPQDLELGNTDQLLSSFGNTRNGSPPVTAETQTPLIRQGIKQTNKENLYDVSTTSEWDNAPTPKSISQTRGTPVQMKKSLHQDTRSPMLHDRQHMGYDWIAALLDSTQDELNDKTESYFKELKEFRRINKDECQNEAIQHENSVDPIAVDPSKYNNPEPAPASPNHTCIHSYSVTDRLFAVPINSDKLGNSRCTVCCKKKTTPTLNSPAFVRVSIPRTTLSSPYRVKPHRRKSFDPSDSAALSRHCLAGYKAPKSAKLPLGRNVDLLNETNRLKSKFTMTMGEAKQLAKRLKSVPVRSRGLDQTSLYDRETRKITDQLLGLTHAMQYQSQIRTKTLLN